MIDPILVTLQVHFTSRRTLLSMMDFMQGFLTGLVAWFITGLDDFLIILLFMNLHRSMLNTISVVIGTMLSVLVMMFICLSIDVTGEKVIGWMGYLHLSGIIPILLGSYGLYRWFNETVEEPISQNSYSEAGGIGIAAFLTYLSNSTDDIIVNVALLQTEFLSTFTPNWWGFLAGIFLGALITCGIACFFLTLKKDKEELFKKDKSVLGKISNYLTPTACIAIIIVGIVIIAGGFSF